MVVGTIQEFNGSWMEDGDFFWTYSSMTWSMVDSID